MCKQDPFVTLKALAILSTILSFIAGLAIISMGFTRFEYFSQISEAVGIKYAFISISLSILGLYIAIVSFFGFVILIFTKLNILNLYFHLMVAAFLLQVVLGGYTLIHEQIAACQIQQNIQCSFVQFAMDSTSRNVMDRIESSLQCCGLRSSTDYLMNSYDILSNYRENKTLPASCCMKHVEQCAPHDSNHFTRGCALKLCRDTLNFLHHFGVLVSISSPLTILSAMIVFVHGQAIGENYF